MQTKYCRLSLVVLLLTGILAVHSSPQMRPKYSEWSTPVNMGSPVNTEENDVQPSISKDGLSLYFVRSPRGGKTWPFGCPSARMRTRLGDFR